MDKGTVESFDTPANLFVAGGIFYTLCVQVSFSVVGLLSRDD